MGECNPKNEEEVLAAMSQVAAKLGFDVAESEFRLAQLAAQELDDEQLDMVAGGREGCLSMYKHALGCLFVHRCDYIVLFPTETCDDLYECVSDAVRF